MTHPSRTRDVEGYKKSILATVSQLRESNEFEYINDALIECVKHYSEFRLAGRNLNVLELGSGPGHLTRAIMSDIKPALLIALDFSPEMIQGVSAIYNGHTSVEFRLTDIAEFDPEGQTFDIIVTSFTLHHLLQEEREELFGRCRRWLNPAGVFANGDVYADEDPALLTYCNLYIDSGLRKILTKEEFRARLEHRTHEHRCSIERQRQDIIDAGFAHVLCAHKRMDRGVLIAFNE